MPAGFQRIEITAIALFITVILTDLLLREAMAIASVIATRAAGLLFFETNLRGEKPLSRVRRGLTAMKYRVDVL